MLAQADAPPSEIAAARRLFVAVQQAHLEGPHVTGGASHAQLALARARQRAWTPTRERAEILTALTEVFTAEDLGADCAIEAAAVLLGEALDDAVFIDLLSPDRTHMYPLGAHHPEPAARALLDDVADVLFRADEGFTASVLDSAEALLIPSVTPAEMLAVQPDLAPIADSLGVRGFIVAPVDDPRPLFLSSSGRCDFASSRGSTRTNGVSSTRWRCAWAVRGELAPGRGARARRVPCGPVDRRVDGARARDPGARRARRHRPVGRGHLGLSSRTVDGPERIQARLGVRTRAELVALARSL